MKMFLPSRPVAALIALLIHTGIAFGDEPPWKAAIASAVITPQEPVMLAGYASRTQPFAGVLDDLRARALALEDSAGTRALLITADVIGFTAEVAEMIRQRIAERTGIAREHIVLSGSHTHTGPALMLRRGAGSTLTEEMAAKSIACTRQVQDTCVQLAADAASRLVPARLSLGAGVVNFPMNRREFTANGVILGLNPSGPVDRGVGVLRIDAADGSPLGVLFRASCHNTTFGSNDNSVSADYAGYAQTHIEREFPGVQAMFMQGFAGDTNPYPNSHNDPAKRPAVEIARAHGAELGAEVVRVVRGKLKPVAGPLCIASGAAELPLQPRPPKEELERLARSAGGSWKKWVVGLMLADAAEGRAALTHYSAPVSVWQFGEGLTMICLGGEVVVDYVRLIEHAVGPLNLWLAAYCHDCFGYIPSARLLREGGYETRGIYAGGIGFFAPEAEAALVNKVSELTEAARAKPER